MGYADSFTLDTTTPPAMVSLDSEVPSSMTTLPMTVTSTTKTVSIAPKMPTIHGRSWYIGWYIGIAAFFIIVIGVWVGVVYYMSKNDSGIFKSYQRPAPEGYVGGPINGEQVALTPEQIVILKQKTAEAIARLAAN